MTDTRTLPADSAIDRIFGPIIAPQTWINMLYLMISFPLGIAYFVILVPMVALGVGTAVMVAGLFVLWAALVVAGVLSELDRGVANRMLGARIPARLPSPPAVGNIFEKMIASVRHPGTVKRIIYLFVRFPMGIFSFILVMTLLPISVLLLTLPFTYTILPVTVGASRVDTFDEAIYMCCFGAVFTLLSVHALNSWTGVCRRFAQGMLH